MTRMGSDPDGVGAELESLDFFRQQQGAKADVEADGPEGEIVDELPQDVEFDSEFEPPPEEYIEREPGEIEDVEDYEPTIDAVVVQAPAAGGGGAMLGTLGVLVGLAGLILAVGAVAGVAPLASATTALAPAGMTPGVLLTIGAVLICVALVWRRQSARVAVLQQQLEHHLGSQGHLADRLQSTLDYLVESQQASLDRPPASGEELDRVLMFMQRQDEKINNLTRAFKMYGKPLVEISNHSADTATEVGELKTQQDGLQEIVKRGFQRMEEAFRTSADGADADTLIERVDELQRSLQSDVEGVVTKLEGGFAETGKSLVEEIDKLLAGVGSGGDGDHEIEGAVREIQRELAAVATTLASVQQALRNGSRAAAAAPAAASPARASAPKSSKGKGKGGKEPPAGLASSIAGTRKGKGKNVLGAIAKLKQMRE